LSAYQVAQLNGFTGTEAEWLASLEGDQGPQGIQGEPGADGADGATGPAGPGVAAGGTAGQILSKVDGADYNTEWVSTAPAAAYTSVVKHQVKLGETIAKGQAVYVSSADGTNMIVSKASNASEATSSKTMGLLETGGALNAQVNVITEGLLAGLDTTAAVNAGVPVWLGTSGNLIYGLASKPVAPAHLVFIGVVTRVNANNGEIFVRPQNGFELNEIHDVLISSPVTGEVIQRTVDNLWENKTLAEAGISAVGHTHDDRYYTEAEITTLLSGKSDTGHTHTIANVTGLQSALDDKADDATTLAGYGITDAYTKTAVDSALSGKSSTSHNHSLDSLSNVTITGNTSGELLKWNGTAWVNNTIAEAGVAAASHTHPAADITSGTFDIARIPTGTTATTVALGNHSHAGYVTTSDTGTVTNAMLAGSIANNKLTNSSITINGSAISLGGTVTTPDTNTTYTFGSGSTNGAFSVTPSGGTAQAVSIFGLGSAAYTASTAYAAASHTHSYLPLSGGTLTGTLYVSNLTISGTTGALTSSAVLQAAGITSTGALTRSVLSGGGSTTATFDNSGNLVRTASSERYKDQIQEANFTYEDVLALGPKTYKLKSELEDDENARTYGGFIAEEVDQIESLKVFVNYMTLEDGTKIPDGINYGEMVSALVSALKHQDAIIKDLTTRIENLENK
jgi:hypothetical protein